MHLVNMAEFYAYNSKFMSAEGLFRQAIETLEKTPIANPMQVIGAKRKYVRMLAKMDKRESEALQITQSVDEQAKEFAQYYWWGDLERYCIPNITI